MNSLFFLSKKRIFAIYFIVFVIIVIGVNIGTRVVNEYYNNEIIEQENLEFMELFFHLMEYSDEDVALESAIHFSHTNNTSFKIMKNGEQLIVSEREPSDSIIYYNLLNNDEYIFEIDNANSTTSIIRDDEVFFINIIVFSSFTIVVLYFLYSRRRRGVRTVHDIKLIQRLLDSREECKNEFEYHEFHQIYHDVLHNLETIDLLMQKRIDNQNALVHDLKTPITILKHHLQEDKSIVENKDAIIQSLNDLTMIATDLVSEQYQNIHVKLNITNIVVKEAKKYIQTFKTKNIKMKIDVAPGLYIGFSRRDLSRVLQNLLTNAYYYSFNDSVVEIQLYKGEQNVILIISNNGEKMTESLIKTIFDKKRSDKKIEKHTNGLGLHFTKLLLENAGARIEASSDNLGNHFRVEFPMKDKY